MVTTSKAVDSPKPDHRIAWEPSPRWVRVKFGGETIADSKAVMLLHETGHLPVYYFPRSDIRLDLLEATTHSTHCPYKGDAAYWTVQAGGRTAQNAVWSYPAPIPERAEIKDYMAFYWDRMDQWFEEEEEVFVHARDPYKRIDTMPSSRHIRIALDGVTLADTRRAHLLFETGLPTRYYIPQRDVEMAYLTPTETHTRCPYKGIASYWRVSVGQRQYSDLAWAYFDPIPECPKVKDLLCFFNEKVDIYVDSQLQERPKTPWSKK